MRLLLETGRFILVAAALAMVMPLFFMLLLLLDGEPVPLGLYWLGMLVSLTMAVLGGLLFGLPGWLLASRLGWHESLLKLMALGGACGTLATGAMFTLAEPDLFSIVIAPILGVPAGLLAAWLWFMLHKDESSSSRS